MSSDYDDQTQSYCSTRKQHQTEFYQGSSQPLHATAKKTTRKRQPTPIFTPTPTPPQPTSPISTQPTPMTTQTVKTSTSSTSNVAETTAPPSPPCQTTSQLPDVQLRLRSGSLLNDLQSNYSGPHDRQVSVPPADCRQTPFDVLASDYCHCCRDGKWSSRPSRTPGGPGGSLGGSPPPPPTPSGG